MVAETGGVVGAWPAGGVNGSLKDFVEATLRLIELLGIEHVGLGSDMDGGPDPVLAGYGQIPRWVDGLRRGGLSDDELALVAGGNALRLLERVVGP
ncbi:MAG: membrane dipeptidase [Gemmatimonadota bacterium]